MKKLALSALSIIAVGVIGTAVASSTTEVVHEAGWGHPLLDHKI
jgi:hypothetical protein